MSTLLFINILVLVFLFGWSSHWLFNRVRLVLRSRRPVVVAPGESGMERYQRQKAARKALQELEPIEPPAGTPPEAAERFRKLKPIVQHQIIEARKRIGLTDG